jgi:hypothetical protein
VDDGDEREPDGTVPKVVAGLAMAAAGVQLGPVPALALGAGGFLAESLAEHVWLELRPDARRRNAEMLSTAAEAIGCDYEELGRLIGASEAKRLQAGLAMSAAERTSWPPKVRALGRALGRALAAGLIAEDTAVDVPQFALNAMVDLERLHVSLLDLLVRYEPTWFSNKFDVGPYVKLPSGSVPAKGSALPPVWRAGPRKWTGPEITNVRPALRPVLTSLIGTLVRHGLAEYVDQTRPALDQLGREMQGRINQQAAFIRGSTGHPMTFPPRPPIAPTAERIWSPTELGELVLGFYEEAGAEAGGTSPEPAGESVTS